MKQALSGDDAPAKEGRQHSKPSNRKSPKRANQVLGDDDDINEDHAFDREAVYSKSNRPPKGVATEKELGEKKDIQHSTRSLMSREEVAGAKRKKKKNQKTKKKKIARNELFEAGEPTDETEASSSVEPVFSFSADILQLAKQHVDFLKFMHQTGVSHPPFITNESVRRYCKLWLPLLAKRCDLGLPVGDLIPPPDVAWLWHCHRLAPSHYLRYIAKQYSSEILGTLPENPYATQSNDYSRRVWKQMFQFQDEPYFLRTDASVTIPEDRFLIGFDLLTSSKSQAKFLYQVERIQVNQGIVNKYLHFLWLAKGPKPSFKFVPTMEIDLVWHTHMTGVSPFQYKNDCIKICGQLFDHDDSLGEDRSDGGVLDQSFRMTGDLWMKTYGDYDYTLRGGYRGEPPDDYFAPHKVPTIDPPECRSRADEIRVEHQTRNESTPPTSPYLYNSIRSKDDKTYCRIIFLIMMIVLFAISIFMLKRDFDDDDYANAAAYRLVGIILLLISALCFLTLCGAIADENGLCHNCPRDLGGGSGGGCGGGCGGD